MRTDDETIKALRGRWRKPVTARRSMPNSSIHARTFAGQRGMLYGHYADPAGGVLAAVSFRQGIAWVDSRDLILEGQGDD